MFEIKEMDVDSDFDINDNSCDLCINQLDNTIRKLELYISGEHQTNAYVHSQCLQGYDKSDAKKLISKIWGTTFPLEEHTSCKHTTYSGVAGTCDGCDIDLCVKCLEGHHLLGHDIVEKEVEESDSK